MSITIQRISFLQCRICCSHQQPYWNTPFSFPFLTSVYAREPIRGKKAFMKPWRKQKLQVTPVIDEHPRQCVLSVSHSMPDPHSHFFFVFANSGLIPPGCHFSEQTKTRQSVPYKAACQTLPRRDRGTVSDENEEKGEERDCKDFWKHPPLKTPHPHPREKLSKTMS